jgi:hypothetical protein
MIMWDKKTGKRLHPSPAMTRNIMLAAALLATPAITSCATKQAHDDGYPLNPWGEKARETDKEIRKLEDERDKLLHEGIKTQADAMRKALIEKRLGDLYNKKLGRKRW